MDERRMIVRLVNYWDRLRGENELPLIARFNAESISDLKPQMASIERREAGGGYNYKFVSMGAALKELYGCDMTGQTVSAREKHFPGTGILEKLDDLASTRRLQIDEGKFVNAKHRVVRYRACMMPFTEGQGGEITTIVCGFSWKEF